MANLFTKQVKDKYDLKGSWIDRTSEENSSVKKDCDLVKELGTNFVLPMDPQNVAATLQQLEDDTKLLKDHNIMDYSLLLGLNQEESINGLKSISSEIDDLLDISDSNIRGPPLPVQNTPSFIIGIIDILQSYNFSKKGEHFLKVYGRCKNPHGLSCVPPNQYQERFMKRMRDLFGLNSLSDQVNIALE